VLVVAGHDPSYRVGYGAGVDADREVCTHFGVRAECVVATETDQDGARVKGVRPRAEESWLAEARALAGSGVQAVKSGLLARRAAVEAMAELVDELRAAQPDLPVVVDPVLAASGGERFLDPDGVRALLTTLLPRGVILTPNLPEAAELAETAPATLARDPGARLKAAEALLARGAAAVVLKGGHASDALARDLVLARGGACVWLERRRVRGARVHGSGCRFASAIAASLALGRSLEDSARAAGDFLGALLSGLSRGGSA
jgi:hydroxymethylpyrimidine/phosphomethylpyrimidine kinase